MQREEQPILIVEEKRIDLVLYDIALAAELRTLIGNLQRFAFLIFPLEGHRTGLRVPFPDARNFNSARPSIERLHVPRNLSAPSPPPPPALPHPPHPLALRHLLANPRPPPPPPRSPPPPRPH